MRYLAILRVDLAAMERGAADGSEVCEIDANRARRVLNVTHLGRGATAAQRIALLWSKPKCASVECSSMFVQIDHRIPWATSKHTRLDELDPLCEHDHDLKTYEGWALVRGTGRRAFVPPDDPRHPKNRPKRKP